MVPKPVLSSKDIECSFRAVLFRMVPKQNVLYFVSLLGFRAVLFRMVPKRAIAEAVQGASFRAVLFRMVPKLQLMTMLL